MTPSMELSLRFGHHSLISCFVKAAIDRHLGAFTKQDIREWCPNISDSAIEGAIRSLVKAGRIQRKGGGRSTYYVKL